MSAFPELMTPDELAEQAGWSPRHVRKLARELGACRIMGNRMTLTPEDVATILEHSKPCPSPSIDVARSGTSVARLPGSAYEALLKLRARKSPSELQQSTSKQSGKVLSMDRERS